MRWLAGRFWGRRVWRLVASGLLVLVVALASVLGTAWWMPLPERLGARDSVVVEYRDGQPAYVFLSADEKWRISRPLEEIDAAYVEALVAFEDRRFWTHPGVDVLAIGRAALGNVRSGRVESGASTITMQLARLLEPRPRTLRSKVIEAFRAIQLEMHLSKEEVLGAYVRFLPFGRNIEGLEAAAQSYFGHSAAHLSEGEIAVLLAVPQGPNGRYPSAGNAERLARARARVVKRLVQVGVFEEAVGAEAESREVPRALQPFAREIPHAAMWLTQGSGLVSGAGSERIRTTLDAGVQRLATRILQSYEGEARRLGIENAAVVVMDHEASEVRALVGNFEFSGAAGAQIPAFAAMRSPGSLLKPLIYAEAIDRGLALPGFLVEDVPFASGSYRPENYTGRFMGLVELEEALSLSLNIPFVRLLGEIGVETLVGQMQQMGASGLRRVAGHYGLSLAVGAGEVSALEVADFYATLARGGRYVPTQVVQAGAKAGAKARAKNKAEGLEIYSQGASWLTAQSLARRDRPDFPARRQLGGAGPVVHWKTGTSYGHRDAWTAGFMGNFTAVVWMGNLDNRSNAALVGGERAAPVLFDVLEGLNGRGWMQRGREPARPDDLREIEVCAYSGHVPGEACEHTRKAWALESQVPTRACPYHVRRDVEDATGLLLTRRCRAGRAYTSKSFVVWPAGVRRFLSEELSGAQRHAGAMSALPDYAPGCEGALESAQVEGGPRIVSPRSGQVLVLIPGLSPEHQKVELRAEGGALSGNSGGLSWFVNGEFLGRVEQGASLWWTPAVGQNSIVVMDDAAHSSSLQLEVRETL